MSTRPTTPITSWTLIALVTVCVCITPTLAAGQSVYYDGFEAPSLNPFWTFYSPGNNGTFSLDTSVAHSGAQSLRLSSQAFGGNAFAVHTFPSPVFGTVDVYVYDPLISGLGYKELRITGNNWPLDQSANPANSYEIFYDWGSLETWLYYPIDPTDPNTAQAGIVVAPQYASPGWRRWTIQTSPTNVTIQIDGVTVFSRPIGYTFTSLNLNNASLAGYANFDDFSFTPAPTYQITTLYDPEKAVKSGATIPIKLEVTDRSGNNLSSPGIPLHAVSVTRISTAVSSDVEDAGDANPDNDFRYDATVGDTGGYIFNLETLGLATGTYNLNFTVAGDSSVYAVSFQVK